MQPQGGDPGYIDYSDTAAGSLTFTDPQQSTDDRQYQATITSRNPQYTAAIQQLVSIKTYEPH